MLHHYYIIYIINLQTFFMSSKGIYSKEVKEKFIKTQPVIDSNEIVMTLEGSEGKIVNQIMQKWETPYMEKLANTATSSGGDVLEVGFGMGISANFIEKSNKIKTHTVIECHPTIISNAKKKYSKEIKNGRFILLEGFWEDITKKLPDKHYDGILFDSCPLDKEVEFFQFFPFFKEANRLLKDSGIFTYFSDEASEISKQHRKELEDANFHNIKFEVCPINPPENCIYWKAKSIVVPIIRKN